MDRFTKWTTEALRDYEERLYDQEVSGLDTWFERDQVLWELNKRHCAAPTSAQHAATPSPAPTDRDEP